MGKKEEIDFKKDKLIMMMPAKQHASLVALASVVIARYSDIVPDDEIQGIKDFSEQKNVIILGRVFRKEGE